MKGENAPWDETKGAPLLLIILKSVPVFSLSAFVSAYL